MQLLRHLPGELTALLTPCFKAIATKPQPSLQGVPQGHNGPARQALALKLDQDGSPQVVSAQTSSTRSSAKIRFLLLDLMQHFQKENRNTTSSHSNGP